MSDVNVLIVFYSRYGTAERVALAAGVGAIQARGNIRLRRVADHADQTTIDATPAWRESLDRMNRDYVVPRPADPQWADVIVLATPSDSCAEIESYCASLRSIAPMAGSSRARWESRSTRSTGHGRWAGMPPTSMATCWSLRMETSLPPRHSRAS